MLNEYKLALLPLEGTSRVAKCYSTLSLLILLKISSSRASLLKKVLPIIEGNAVSYE
jgi:hypothetical protein